MNEHWRYFHALEDDLQDCAQYVHFDKSNFNTYSTEFARILLASASEFDTIAKPLCKEINPDREVGSIGDYREVILDKYPRMPETEIQVPRYQLSLEPWANWYDGKNPEWWRSYNAVKHERNEHFEKATLGASLRALSGLLVGLMYWFREDRVRVEKGPDLYEPESYDIITGPDHFWSYSLPGEAKRRTDRMGGGAFEE